MPSKVMKTHSHVCECMNSNFDLGTQDILNLLDSNQIAVS